MIRRLGLALALATAAMVTACSKSDAGAPRPAGDAADAVDLETMAFLSEARALHHEANVKEEAGDTRGAAAVVLRITRARRPHPQATIPEIEEVLADAWARVSELDLRLGEPVAAARAAEEGLAHARAPTYFRGHLLEVQGIAEETRSSMLADAGDALAAAKARASAMALLEEAVAVQDRVIADALDGGTGEGGRP